MKKLFLLPAAIIASVTLASSVVMAQDANISNTGPGSTNTIIVDNDSSVVCENDNDITINIGGGGEEQQGGQNAGSGDANNNSNTTGGNANSGDASNNSNVDVGVDIENGCGNQVAQAGDQPEDEPEDQDEPAVGGGDVLPDTTQLEVLPDTGLFSGVQMATIATLALAGIALVSRGGLAIATLRK